MTPDDATLKRVLDLRTLNLPPRPKIDELHWQRIVDSLGDDALDVWLILDDATRPEDLKGTRTPIQRAIHDALLDAGIDLFPHTPAGHARGTGGDGDGRSMTLHEQFLREAAWAYRDLENR